MLLIVGETMVAYQRDLALDGVDAPFVGPWPSGSPAICAYVAARLGTPTTFVGAVGHDEHAEVILGGLVRGGVDTDHVRIRSEAHTAWARVTYESGGERTFEFHVSDSAATLLRADELGDLPELARWCHVSGSALVFGGPLVEATLEAAHRAKAAGATLSVDPNVRPELLAAGLRERLAEVILIADVVLPSEGELEALDIDPTTLTATGAVVCTTMGDGGARVLDGGSRVHIPAVPVDAVDADGAGDTFAAGFIAASLRGATPIDAASMGAAAAALSVVHHGPMTATFEQLKVTRP